MKAHTSFTTLFFSLIFLLLLTTELSIAQKKHLREKNFKAIFDGKTLQGWEGDKTYWRVENGVLIGEVTPQTILKQNNF